MPSSLYQTLSDAALSRVFEKTLHTEVRSSSLMTGGLFNTTYRAETADFGTVVLRVEPVNRHLLMPFEHRLMEAETRVYALCRERGIPVSEVLACDTTKTVLDRDFMMVRCLDAKPLSAFSLTEDDRARLSYDVGRACAAMHGITHPRFGRIVEREDRAGKDGFARWSDFLYDELLSWETVARGADKCLFSEEEHEEFRRLFRAAAPVLDEIQTPCLVHTDLWFGNVLAYDRGGKPEFAAVIDADRALWGDPEFEFSSIRWMHGEARFWDGYGKPLADDKNSVIRRAVYHILNRLWNAYVYLWEYNMPDEMAGERELARGEAAFLGEIFPI